MECPQYSIWLEALGIMRHAVKSCGMDVVEDFVSGGRVLSMYALYWPGEWPWIDSSGKNRK